MTHKNILEGAGTISHGKALEKAHKEYDKYMRNPIIGDIIFFDWKDENGNQGETSELQTL